jgi:cell wall-associated NlpC family hydrolase
MAGGLGPNEFDCSGLVIASFAAVMDVPVDRWRDLRHVRDLWKVAGEAGLHRSAYAVGDLLVIPRTYTISGNRQSVPGHIGFVTKVDSGGLNILHADWRQETVVESFRPRALPIFGAISLAKEVLLSRY